MNKYLIYIVVSTIFLSASCKNISVYNANVEIPNNGWVIDSIATFKVNITDTASVHHILINVRNTVEYPNSNLYLFINTFSPTGASLRDTLECFFADNKGKWLGKGFGLIRDNLIPYKRYIRFPEEGIYEFSIQQGMRTHQLKGVKSVGLRIEKEKP
jgi:gliding motility-associated lipoprotein GldH